MNYFFRLSRFIRKAIAFGSTESKRYDSTLPPFSLHAILLLVRQVRGRFISNGVDYDMRVLEIPSFREAFREWGG